MTDKEPSEALHNDNMINMITIHYGYLVANVCSDRWLATADNIVGFSVTSLMMTSLGSHDPFSFAATPSAVDSIISTVVVVTLLCDMLPVKVDMRPFTMATGRPEEEPSLMVTFSVMVEASDFFTLRNITAGLDLFLNGPSALSLGGRDGLLAVPP